MKINNKIVFIIIVVITIIAIGIKIYSDNKITIPNENIDNYISNSTEITKLEENGKNNVDIEIGNDENTVNAIKESESNEKNIITITEENFEENVLKSDKIVIVDFWASWCGPCTYMSPILEEIANENDDIILAKINVDEQETLSMKYQVTMIPTMIIFKNGKEEKQVIGVVSKEKMLEYINEIK